MTTNQTTKQEQHRKYNNIKHATKSHTQKNIKDKQKRTSNNQIKTNNNNSNKINQKQQKQEQQTTSTYAGK